MNITDLNNLMESSNYGFIEIPKIKAEMNKEKDFQLIHGNNNHLLNVDNNYIDRMLQQQKKINEMSENLFLKENLEMINDDKHKKYCDICECKECKDKKCKICNCKDCEHKEKEKKEMKKIKEEEKPKENKKEDFMNMNEKFNNIVLYTITGITLLVLFDKFK
jgi:hypothetical protein